MVKTRLFLMILIICLLFCPFAWSWSFEARKEEICKNLEDFKLQDLSGKEVSLKGFIGNDAVVFMFWAKWCPACRRSITKLMKKSSKMDASRVILVNVGDKKEAVESFLNRFDSNPFTVLLDYEMALASDCKVIGIPSFIIIDKDGRVEFEGNYLPRRYEADLMVKN